MKNTHTKVIFDLDGTLYPLGGQQFGTFEDSLFCADLNKRVTTFIALELGLSERKAREIVDKINRQFNGDLSVGFETVYEIDRHRYYAATWKCEPSSYIQQDTALVSSMSHLQGNVLLLTAAPSVWAKKTLTHLGLRDIFGDNLITGELDIRKPNPQAFLRASETLAVEPTNIIAVGDQNLTDIVPAKSVGMTTVLIGPHLQDAGFRVDTIYQALDIVKDMMR